MPTTVDSLNLFSATEIQEQQDNLSARRAEIDKAAQAFPKQAVERTADTQTADLLHRAKTNYQSLPTTLSQEAEDLLGDFSRLSVRPLSLGERCEGIAGLREDALAGGMTELADYFTKALFTTLTRPVRSFEGIEKLPSLLSSLQADLQVPGELLTLNEALQRGDIPSSDDYESSISSDLVMFDESEEYSDSIALSVRSSAPRTLPLAEDKAVSAAQPETGVAQPFAESFSDALPADTKESDSVIHSFETSFGQSASLETFPLEDDFVESSDEIDSTFSDSYSQSADTQESDSILERVRSRIALRRAGEALAGAADLPASGSTEKAARLDYFDDDVISSSSDVESFWDAGDWGITLPPSPVGLVSAQETSDDDLFDPTVTSLRVSSGLPKDIDTLSEDDWNAVSTRAPMPAEDYEETADLRTSDEERTPRDMTGLHFKSVKEGSDPLRESIALIGGIVETKTQAAERLPALLASARGPFGPQSDINTVYRALNDTFNTVRRTALDQVFMADIAERLGGGLLDVAEASARAAEPFVAVINEVKQALENVETVDAATAYRTIAETLERIPHDTLLDADRQQLETVLSRLQGVAGLVLDFQSVAQSRDVAAMQKMALMIGQLRNEPTFADLLPVDRLIEDLDAVGEEVIEAAVKDESRFVKKMRGLLAEPGNRIDVLGKLGQRSRSIESNAALGLEERARAQEALLTMSDEILNELVPAETDRALLDPQAALGFDELAAILEGAPIDRRQTDAPSRLEQLRAESVVNRDRYLDRLVEMRAELNAAESTEALYGLRMKLEPDYQKAMLREDAATVSEAQGQLLNDFADKLLSVTRDRVLQSAPALTAPAREALDFVLERTGCHPAVATRIADGTITNAHLEYLNTLRSAEPKGQGLEGGERFEGFLYETPSDEPEPIARELDEILHRIVLTNPDLDSAMIGLRGALSNRDVSRYESAWRMRADLLTALRALTGSHTLEALGIDETMTAVSATMLESLAETIAHDGRAASTLDQAVIAAYIDHGLSTGVFSRLEAGRTLPGALRAHPAFAAALHEEGRPVTALSQAARNTLGFVPLKGLGQATRLDTERLLDLVMRSNPGARRGLTEDRLEARRRPAFADLPRAAAPVGEALDKTTALANFVARSDVLAGDVKRLGTLERELAAAKREKLSDPLYRSMTATLREAGRTQTADALAKGETPPVEGARLAAGLTMLDGLLALAETRPDEAGLLARELRFQPRVDLDRLTSSALRGPRDSVFAERLAAFVREPGKSETRAALSDYLNQKGALDKARAVLYFQDPGRLTSEAALDELLHSTLSLKGRRLLENNGALRDALLSGTTPEGGFAGAADLRVHVDFLDRQAATTEKALADKIETLETLLPASLALEVKDCVREAFFSVFNRIMQTNPDRDLFAESLGVESLEEWDFFRSVIGIVEHSGIDPDVARPYVTEFIGRLNPEAFDGMMRIVEHNPAVGVREAILQADLQPIAEREEERRTALTAQVSEMLENLLSGELLSLSDRLTAGIGLPAVIDADEEGALSPTRLAELRGLAVRADPQGRGFEVLLNRETALRLPTESRPDAGPAGLTALGFEDADSCSRFVSALILRRVGLDDMALARAVRPVNQNAAPGLTETLETIRSTLHTSFAPRNRADWGVSRQSDVVSAKRRRHDEFADGALALDVTVRDLVREKAGRIELATRTQSAVFNTTASLAAFLEDRQVDAKTRARAVAFAERVDGPIRLDLNMRVPDDRLPLQAGQAFSEESFEACLTPSGVCLKGLSLEENNPEARLGAFAERVLGNTIPDEANQRIRAVFFTAE